MRSLLFGLLPGGAVAAAAALAVVAAPPTLLAEAARGYPWVACAVAFALAAFFHRSRPAALALLLAGTLQWALDPPSGFLTVAVVGSTVALVTSLLALTRDRGIASPLGLAQAAFVALAGGIGLTAAGHPPEAVRTLLLTPSFPPGLTAWTGLPEMTALVYAGALVAVGYGALVRGGPVERSLPWFLLCAGMALHGAPGGAARGVWLLAAAMVLALGVVEASHAMAYRDDLTGLPGRRALARDLEALGGRYVVAMVDVDHFKKFNDRHGHDVGDQVLRMVGGRLARAPGGARAYRYGGEEFTVLLPGRSLEEALPHLESVRASVAGASFALRGWDRPSRRPEKPKKKSDPATLSVTVSIGVAGGDGGSTPEDVLKKADQALYRAKRAGRNRVAT